MISPITSPSHSEDTGVEYGHEFNVPLQQKDLSDVLSVIEQDDRAEQKELEHEKSPGDPANRSNSRRILSKTNP